MSQNPVEQILSHYKSENPGVLSNLARMLNYGYLGGTGKMVILPVDQGFEHGPARSFQANPKGYDPHYHFKLALKAGCSAYAAPLGFLEAGASQFAHTGLPLILKLNNSESLSQKDHPKSAVTALVERALELGCVGIGYTIYPGSPDVNEAYEALAELSYQAKRVGLVVVVWSYCRGGNLSKKGETALDVVAYGAQIAAQMGAHIIKVKPPTDHIEQEAAKKAYATIPKDTLAQRAAHVVESCFANRRIVIFSGGEAKSDSEVLTAVEGLAKGGAYGSIMGRNAFQRPEDEAVEFLNKVMDIYKKT